MLAPGKAKAVPTPGTISFNAPGSGALSTDINPKPTGTVSGLNATQYGSLAAVAYYWTGSSWSYLDDYTVTCDGST